VAAGDTQLVRNPRFWLARVLVLAAALGLGLLLQRVVAERLAAIQTLAERDVVQARAELAALLRIGGTLLFGLTGVTGLSIVASSRRAIAAMRFPPPGIWSWDATRIVSGPRTTMLGRVGVVLGAVLLACSLAGGGLTWYMAAVLLACKAR
jgi:hypothetical protein